MIPQAARGRTDSPASSGMTPAEVRGWTDARTAPGATLSGIGRGRTRRTGRAVRR
jgi:hypothetical protein